MFGAYNRKFPDARTPNDWICSDPEVVAKYTADPLCGQDATVGLTREMLRGIRMIQKPANLQRMDKALPVFFIAGKRPRRQYGPRRGKGGGCLPCGRDAGCGLQAL